ncbi:MAG TPA: DUF2752 domain-containing protein [Lacipirellula sp.]
MLLSGPFVALPRGNRVNDSSALTTRMRWLLAAVGLAALTLVATARSLTPDARGFGTHEQLGFSACGFMSLTGRRCPTCGMTTAWAYGTRGDVRSAVAANGGGTVLLLLTMVAAPWLIASALLGRWWGVKPTTGVLLIIGGAWLAVTVLDWLRRIAS